MIRVERPVALGRPGLRLSIRVRPSVAQLVVPVSLLVLAAVVRVAAASMVTFPPTEDSAYYVDVARNLVSGHGLVSDAMWSYATPPLVLPKPAFELWLPMGSFIAALPMAVLGTAFTSAQWGGVLLGSLAAPLAWAVGREAAAQAGLSGRRAGAVAIGSGLLVAVFGPFLLGAMAPDSTTPFLVFGLLGALLMPRALRVAERQGAEGQCGPGTFTDATVGPSVGTVDLLAGQVDPTAAIRGRRVALRRSMPGLALGVCLGLAYLSRQEAAWLGLGYLAMVAVAMRSAASGRRRGLALGALWPVVLGGLVVVVPWLARNALVFGSPFAGQALQNAFLVRNEQIFAYLDPPTLGGFLAQGLPQIVGHQATGILHNLVTVLLVSAFPVGIAGLAALPGLRHSPALRRPTALQALLVSGFMTFLVTGLFFPVATLWGTFLHGSGPLLVGLCVTAMLGTDALVARIGRARHWSRTNAWLAPAALLAVCVPFAGLQVIVIARQTAVLQAQVSDAAVQVRRLLDLAPGPGQGVDARQSPIGSPVPAAEAVIEGGPIVIADRPIWMADALGVSAIALPDEGPDSILALSRAFNAPILVELDERGRYPEALLGGNQPCIREASSFGPLAGGSAWLFRVDAGCRQ